MLHCFQMFCKCHRIQSKNTHDRALQEEHTHSTGAHLTYPWDIFILGLFDHGNERKASNVARGAPSSADFSPAACCVGRSVRDQGWWPGASRAQPLVIMCPANPRARNACSDWIQHLSADQSTPRAEFSSFFFSGYVTKLEKSRNIQQNSKVFSSSQHTVTWWTDYVFEQSMNMKHPSRFNPALLSHSTRPIRSLWPAPQGELIEVLGWTYWVFGGEPWLAGHWHVQISGRK